MKKNHLFYTILLAGAMTMPACNGLLDIEPKAQLPAENVNTAKNLEAILTSSYGELMSGSFLGGRLQFYSEMLSDNFIPLYPINTTGFTDQVITRNVNIFNTEVASVWETGYRAIARANDVIRIVEEAKVTDADAAKLQQWKAEALFIRAVAHFELVRLYGQPFSNNPTSDLGVPLRIKALQSDEKIGRNTVAEVYSQVITDLNAAVAGLPTINGNRASKWTAKGYLARVYFNKLDYNSAFTTALDIVQNSGVTLSGTPTTAFRNIGNITPNGGVIFQAISGNTLSGFRPGSNAYGLTTGTGSLVEALDNSNDDYRADDMITVSGTSIFSEKWDANNLNVPVLRLAEVLLIHSESAVLKGTSDLTAAAFSYNLVRDFAVSPYTNVVFANSAAALTAIRTERRIEMLQEGDRYHEVRRLKLTGYGALNFAPNANLRPAVSFNTVSQLLKLPLSETSGNPAIVQN